MNESILVIGAKGQIGSELVEELRRIHGDKNVIATDLKIPSDEFINGGPFYQLDVLDFPRVLEIRTISIEIFNGKTRQFANNLTKS